MAGLIDADQGRRQHRAHRPAIDPAIGVAADALVDRAVVVAGAAADAAQHRLQRRAEQRGAAVVEQHHVVFLRPVGVGGAARPGRERGVDRLFLAGGRARQHAEQRGGVLQRRHHLLDRRQHDMGLGQRLGQVAVTLVGDDDGGAGLGDQEIGAGDADVGGEEALAQDAARLRQHGRRLVEVAVARQVAVGAAKIGLDLGSRQVNRRRDDVRGHLAAQLDDVFAEVGLDRGDAVGLQVLVEPDLLGDHALALGRGLGAELLADVEHDGAGVLGGGRPVDVAAGLHHLVLERPEIEVEIGQGVGLDVARGLAQRIELRQALGGGLAAADEIGLEVAHRGLKRLVGEGALGVGLERGRGDADRHGLSSGPVRRCRARGPCRPASRRHGGPGSACRRA